MDIRFPHRVTVVIRRGEVLRIGAISGRHLEVLRGAVWLTQDWDRHDHVLCAGKHSHFDRSGRVLAMSLGGDAEIVLEEGPSLESSQNSQTPDTKRNYIAVLLRKVRRALSGALSQVFPKFVSSLKFNWSRLAKFLSATQQTQETRRELCRLSDRMLRDIGMRRDQIECASNGRYRTVKELESHYR